MDTSGVRLVIDEPQRRAAEAGTASRSSADPAGCSACSISPVSGRPARPVRRSADAARRRRRWWLSPSAEHDRLALLASVDEITEGQCAARRDGGAPARVRRPGFRRRGHVGHESLNSGELHRIGSRVEGPGREDLERTAPPPPRPRGPVGLPRALASAQSQLIERMTEDDLRAIAADDSDLDLLRALRLRSPCYPSPSAPGDGPSAPWPAAAAPRPRDGEADLRFAEVLSARLALALDNAGLSATVSGVEQRLEAMLTNLAEAVLFGTPRGRSCSPTKRRRACSAWARPTRWSRRRRAS